MMRKFPPVVTKAFRRIGIAAVIAATPLLLPIVPALSQVPGAPAMPTATVLPGAPAKSVQPWLDPGRGEYCRGYMARGAAIRGRLDHARQSVGSEGLTMTPAVAALLNSLSDALVGSEQCPGAGGAPLPTVSVDSRGTDR